jgi:hypothetical protein
MKNLIFSTIFSMCFLLGNHKSFSQTTAPSTTASPTTTTPVPAVTPPAPTILSWSGFVKADYFYDSRQTVNAREGHLLFVPATISKDANGVDANDKPDFNILAIQTRLKMGITGPEFFKMKTSGVIEAEFFGVSNGDINGLRLRHAYVQLAGAKATILMGQFWHPFFAAECFPGTYSFNTGLPFATIDREPQFRITSVGKTKVFGVISSQRDFKNQGIGTDPANTTSGANSLSGLSLGGMPDLTVGVSHSSGPFAAGVTVDYKKVKIGLRNGGALATDVGVGGASAMAYLKYKTGTTTFKAQTIYGQNIGNMLMIGGFGIMDSVGKDPTLTPLASSSSWVEVDGGNAKFEWGIFAGYTKNLGFSDNLKTTAGVTGFLTDIKDAMRIAPRIGWKSNKTKLGIELEYTQATRGAYKAGEATITELATDSKTSNTRLLFMAQYSF